MHFGSQGHCRDMGLSRARCMLRFLRGALLPDADVIEGLSFHSVLLELCNKILTDYAKFHSFLSRNFCRLKSNMPRFKVLVDQ